jgi:hypothetical protein
MIAFIITMLQPKARRESLRTKMRKLAARLVKSKKE